MARMASKQPEDDQTAENTLSPDEVKESVSRMLENGECSIVEVSGKTILKIKVTKLGQKRGKSANIDSINNSILSTGLDLEREGNSKKKRVYRKRGEMPDPGVSHRAEVNRLTQLFQARISRSHMQLFEQCLERFDSKRTAAEKAVEALADTLGIERK